MQPDDFAALVTLTVKTALGPYVERIATLEQANKDLQARLADMPALRDRVVAIETKAALPTPLPAIVETKAVDLTPMGDRLTAFETRLNGVWDRVTVLETKGGQPAEKVDLAPVHEKLAAVAELTKDITGLRERIAVVETRAPIPGPAGLAGKDGANGLNGKDGVDGMGWDDLLVEHDGERTFTIKLMRGERVKEAGSFTLPVQIYRGIYTEGRTYEPGDTVTYARSLWHCLKATVLKPDGLTRDPVTGEPKGPQGKDFWRLVAKGGADGRDGRDAPSTPVVSVGPR